MQYVLEPPRPEMTEEEQKRHEEIMKRIKKKRRRMYKYIEWKILAFIVIVVSMFWVSYSHQEELERFLNPIYYQGAEHQVVQSLSNNVEIGLKVHFIDVGCADSTFIEFPNGKTALIDCAGDNLDRNSSVKALLHYLDIEIYSKRDTKILDYLIITHPDRDHYSGVSGVLQKYQVKNIIRPIVLSKSEKLRYEADEMNNLIDQYQVKQDSEYEDAINSIYVELENDEDSKMFFGSNGLTFSEDDYTFDFIAPLQINYEEEWNNYSSCIRLSYRDRVFLFTGDAEQSVEDEIINEYCYDLGYLKADVLKLGHHGSQTSSSFSFINAVNPKYFTVSTRSGVYSNVPSLNVLSNLETINKDATFFRTDIDGNIIFEVSSSGEMGIYTTRGSFAFVSTFVYIKLYVVLVCLSILIYIFIFQFRALTRRDILIIRRKKALKLKKRLINEAKKEVRIKYE